LWGWRVPFLFGLLIGPVAYYLRHHVEETAEFRSTLVRKTPLRAAWADGKKRMLVTVAVVVLCTVAMYTILFMPTYAVRQLGLAPSGSFLATLLTGCIQIALIPVAGALAARYSIAILRVRAGGRSPAARITPKRAPPAFELLRPASRRTCCGRGADTAVRPDYFLPVIL